MSLANVVNMLIIDKMISYLYSLNDIKHNLNFLLDLSSFIFCWIPNTLNILTSKQKIKFFLHLQFRIIKSKYNKSEIVNF